MTSLVIPCASAIVTISAPESLIYCCQDCFSYYYFVIIHDFVCCNAESKATSAGIILFFLVSRDKKETWFESCGEDLSISRDVPLWWLGSIHCCLLYADPGQHLPHIPLFRGHPRGIWDEISVEIVPAYFPHFTVLLPATLQILRIPRRNPLSGIPRSDESRAFPFIHSASLIK